MPPSVRVQILATEHWSLLATRSLAWNESFSRAAWFVTVVSAAMVALALVANSTDFGHEFRLLALLVLPLLAAVGVATVIRLADLNREDVTLVIAMNRLRRGYLDLAPELEPYFTTGHSEDLVGVMQTYGLSRTRVPALQHALSIALLVGVVVAVLIAALAGLLADTADLRREPAVVIGLAAGASTLAAVTVLLTRQVRRTWPEHVDTTPPHERTAAARAHFPGPGLPRPRRDPRGATRDRREPPEHEPHPDA